MKKILLLSALFIFACSSDDSNDNNDNSNQTFLERYDGVVWESTDTSEIQYVRFNNDTTNIWTQYQTGLNNGDTYECSDLQDDVADLEINGSGLNLTITTNIGNNFFFSYVYPEGDGADILIIAEENGNALEMGRFYYVNYADQELFNTQIDTLVRSSFEIPCD